MRIVFGALLAVASATIICLPDTHTCLLESYFDDVHIGTDPSHHRDEYTDGAFLKIWRDAATKKSLVHIYEDEKYHHQELRHSSFSLRDYNKHYHWVGKYNHSTREVTECKLELFNTVFAPYCLAHYANNTFTGTLGEDFKADWYREHWYDYPTGTDEDIEIVMEQGSTSKPLWERTWAHRSHPDHETYHYHHRQWFNMIETPIDPNLFKVPSNCPQ